MLRLKTGDFMRNVFIQDSTERENLLSAGIYETSSKNLKELFTATIGHIKRLNGWKEDQ